MLPYGAFRRQPVKGLYLIYQLLSTLFVRIPVWIIFAIPRSWRPRLSWDFKRVIYLNLLRHSNQVTAFTGPLANSPNHLAIQPGVNVNGIWLSPVPHLLTGPLPNWCSIANVQPTRIPGYWLHKKSSSIPIGAPPSKGEKVVLCLHGGAYTRLSAHPTDPTSAIPRGLLKYTSTIHRILSVEYRLSVGAPWEPKNPFPAALLDALAGYNYLVNKVGFDPKDIIVEGDSAGGNLAHALTRYLVENQDSPDVKLPAPPGALILLSPWVDLSHSHDHKSHTSSSYLFRPSDYIDTRPSNRWVCYAESAFVGPHGLGAAELNVYISPASLHPSLCYDDPDSKFPSHKPLFKGFPRTFIVAGGAEVLYDQIRTFTERMTRDLGEGDGLKEGEGKVRYHEEKDAFHDHLVFPWCEPERRSTFRAIADWVDKV